MSLGKLTDLQALCLKALAPLEPRWALTGGGALAGFHCRHRGTRDLDLFWHDQEQLGEIPARAIDLLRDAGFSVERKQTARSFTRLIATFGSESVVVDLVTDTAPLLRPVADVELLGQRILIESAHDILVNKLCTLLSRSEIRDLQDVEVLLEAGGDFDQALADAPKKDGGFSAMTLAWVLRSAPIEPLFRGSGLSEMEQSRLTAFKDSLVARLTG